MLDSMAHFAGIAGACEGIVRLLRASYRPADFGGAALEFHVCQADDFGGPMYEGVSVFLYRVREDTARRERHTSNLALELHVLLTAWAKQASRQQEIAGWMMRTLHDHPVLTASLLNEYSVNVFSDGESIRVVRAELSVEEMCHVWQNMTDHPYQLSVAYLAQGLEIEPGASPG
jgi:hypothetical protein